jgi:hypothetical protein
MRHVIEDKDAQSVGLKPVERSFIIEATNPYTQLRFDVVYVLTWGMVVLPLLIVWSIVFTRVMVEAAPMIWERVGRMMG